jgi:hypothetical protein
MKTHALGFRLRANAPEGQKRFPISLKIESGRSRTKPEALRGITEFVLHLRRYGENGSPDGRLPVSFFVEPSYWQRPDAQDRWIVGTANEFWQRLVVRYGLNLYCAACRQIALAMTGREDAIRAAVQHTKVLLDDRAGEAETLRGWSDKTGGWRYGDERMSLCSKDGSAFFFGTICERFHLTDPRTGASCFPPELGGAPLFWNSFDPFLGENTWAALIGPLQVAYLLKSSGAALTPECDEIRLARSLVPACLAMQSPIGGVYARPAAWGDSQERLISNETNLTLYAGLTMLKQMMLEIPQLSQQMVEVDKLRHGLLRYFRRYLYGNVDGELRLHACGAFFDEVFRPGMTANGQPARFAADVHTWGMSILGVDEIDALHGRGTCFRLWETVKRHTGFYSQASLSVPLSGIGFSSGPNDEPIHDVCSPEWTFGAINMCRVLAAEYDAAGPHHDAELASRLREDERSMLEGVSTFEMSPQTTFQSRAFPYVNRIADTGFGWQALPLASLCATAWAMLIQNGFNPFRLGGACASVPHADVV